MANTTTYIDKIVVPNGSNTITANLVDKVSGYIKGITVNRGSEITNIVTNTAYDASSNKIATVADVGSTTFRVWS